MELTRRQSDTEEVLTLLAQAGGKLTAEEDVIFRGKQLILPETTTLMESIEFLRKKRDEDEQPTMFSRSYDYRPWDGARATMRALKRVFGMASQQSTVRQGLFGSHVEAPSLRTIKVDVDRTEQVPWGSMGIPILPGVIFELGASRHPEKGLLFQISAQGPRKHRFQIEGVFNLIAEELKRDSLYRGRAFDGQEDPDFLDLRTVDPSKVIYAEEVMTQLEANVWALMRYTSEMERHGIPLKRAVLFEGPYGTGKTLGAYLTAQIATQNGWSFIYCRPGRDTLRDVMATARLYQPSCVFFEDLDNVAAGEGGRSEHVSELLDLFDGIQSKGTKIMCVLTTNRVETIHKGMVRPGRLDAVIHIGALDVQGVERMAKAVIDHKLLSRDIDWQKVGESMNGFLPAFVREVLDRAMRYSMARNHGVPGKLSTIDLVQSAQGLRPQLELMNDAKDKPENDPLSRVLGQTFKNVLDATVVDTESDPEDGRFWALRPSKDNPFSRS